MGAVCFWLGSRASKRFGRGSRARRRPAAPASLPSPAVVLFSIGAALSFTGLAFRVDRPDHALFGHAAATAASLLVLAAGGRIALAQGQRHDLSSSGSRLDAASVPGALIGVLLGLGLVWAALR